MNLEQQCLNLLEKAMSPMTAIEIANNLCLVGSREWKRRQVRALVKSLRDDGNWIIANLTWGYWLTKNFKLWQDYREGRVIEAKAILAEEHQRKNQPKEACLYEL